jgi:hypothetical protein
MAGSMELVHAAPRLASGRSLGMWLLFPLLVGELAEGELSWGYNNFDILLDFELSFLGATGGFYGHG